MGKIIGTSLAGITQFTIWVILGGIILTVLSGVFGIDMAQVNTPQQDMVNQAMEAEGAQEIATQVVTAINNLPLTNLVIAFMFFFVGLHVVPFRGFMFFPRGRASSRNDVPFALMPTPPMA